ncbi:mediator complex subunit 13 C-terminal-domain-containing protein [Phyllosticta citrichinensis]
MDSLKSSSTSVSAVGGYSAISYRTLAAKSSLEGSGSRNTQIEELSTVETILRNSKHLVFLDRDRLLLWLFEPGATPPVFDQDSLQREQQGHVPHLQNVTEATLKAAELVKFAGRTPGFSAHSGAGSGPNTTNARAANARAFQQNSQPNIASTTSSEPGKQHDPLAIYEALIAAVIASISYQLSISQKMIPLNYRTFISCPRLTQSQTNDDDGPNLQSRNKFYILTLDVHLSTSGTLVISTSVSDRSVFYQLEPTLKSRDLADDQVGKIVRVAPSGLLARYVGTEAAGGEGETASLLHSKRARAIEQWKVDVERWLRRKGIALVNMDGENKWARIQVQISHPSTSKDNRELPNGGYQECLWPSFLCFAHMLDAADDCRQGHQPDESESDAQSTEKAIRWWANGDRDRFKDPLWQAHDWFLGRSEREKALDSRRKARMSQEESTHVAPEPVTTYPSSPLYSRGSAYGDLQAISGVYPTPPDGVLAPNTSGPTPMDGVITGQTSDSTQGQGNGQDTMILPDSGLATGGTSSERHEASQSVHTSAAGHASRSSNGDDLFGDIDEEMFEANDVTEADFNFFDDPDAADFDLMDMSGPPVFDDPPKQVCSPVDGNLGISPNLQLAGSHMNDGEGYSAGGELETTVGAAESGVHMLERAGQTEAKPADLKHASGLQGDDEPGSHVKTPREPSPPLSPSAINQRLFVPEAGGEDRQVGEAEDPKGSRRKSLFDAVDFGRQVAAADSKYAADGRFNFAPPPRDAKDGGGRAPKGRSIVLPSRELSATTMTKTQAGVSDLIQNILAPNRFKGGSTVDTRGYNDSDATSDSSASSVSLEGEQISVAPTRLTAILSLGQKKWQPSVAGTPMASTPGGISLDNNSQEFALGDIDGVPNEIPPLSLFEPGPYDWSLAALPIPQVKFRARASTENRSRRGSFSLTSAASTPASDVGSETMPITQPLIVKEIIAITQILVDQVIFSSLDMIQNFSHSHSLPPDYALPPSPDLLPVQTVQDVVQETFQEANDCDMLKYATIQDVMPEPPVSSAKTHLRPIQRRNQLDPHGNLFFPISTPYIRLNRGDDLWDVLPPALSFWEPLGLAPASGPKNIVAYSVYPANPDLNDAVSGFLDSISMAYEAAKFGSHIRGPALDSSEGDGLVPATFNNVDGDVWRITAHSCIQAMRDACATLGRVLSRINYKHFVKAEDGAQTDAIVIYLVNPFSSPQHTWQLCSAFWALFQAYGPPVSIASTENSKPDVVLQLVPIKYIASFEAPIILEPALLTKMAREVYDRCPPKSLSDDPTALSIRTAPSIQLEETLPRNIPFRLTVDPPSNLLQENSYIHVGYSVSFDGSWITAAWTDNAGKHQTTVSYCLVNRSFVEVAREIYQTSLEIMQARRVTWRLCIARAGVMEREEVETWQSLLAIPSPLFIGAALISVEPNPVFTITSPLPGLTTAQNQSSNSVGVSTPGTPQPGVSPDQHGFTPAATPSESTAAADPSADPEARLVDVTDESWGVILQHRLHNSNSTVEFRPALASGYLVKRGADAEAAAAAASSTGNGGGVADSDTPRGPIAVSVNLIWIGSTAGSHNHQQRQSSGLGANLASMDSSVAGQSPNSPLASPGGGNGNTPTTNTNNNNNGGGGGGSSSSSSSTGSTNNNNGAGSAAAAAAAQGVGGVNPFANQAARTTYDTVLREFLIMYRNLGLLAKLRGMKGTRGGAVPWHVAAALRGTEVLEKLS